MKKKIVICGGHLTPALAVIDLLPKKDWEIIFIGRKYAMEGEKGFSREYKITRKMGLPFISLHAGRLQRKLTRFTFFSLCKIPLGILQSFYWLLRLKPDVILSFGGYVALPVSFTGWILGIPVVTHEQSAVLGLANKIIARFAKKVCVSWPTFTKASVGKEKFVITGNPVRKEALATGANVAHLKGAKLNRNLPLIYVTGGNLGSHSINEVVKEALPKLLEKYQIIHQCGDAKMYHDYEELETLNQELRTELQERYFLEKYIEPEDIGWVLNNSDLVIGRAGANTVCELAALGKPAILIPLPWAGQNEQTENARILEAVGLAKILEQKDLTGDSLYQCINTMIQNIDEYKKAGKEAKKLINLKAGENLVKVLYEI